MALHLVSDGSGRRRHRVKLIYLRLATAELALPRVAARVLQGGHSVPAEVVERRFGASWRNFQRVYKPLVDRWALYDNSGEGPVLMLRRAAAAARRLSVDTGTPFYVFKAGRVVDLNAAGRKRRPARATSGKRRGPLDD